MWWPEKTVPCQLECLGVALCPLGNFIQQMIIPTCLLYNSVSCFWTCELAAHSVISCLSQYHLTPVMVSIHACSRVISRLLRCLSCLSFNATPVMVSFHACHSVHSCMCGVITASIQARCCGVTRLKPCRIPYLLLCQNMPMLCCRHVQTKEDSNMITW